MNPNILHPCGRLYMLERSLEVMTQEQLRLSSLIHNLCGDPVVDEACETLSMHAIVMSGTAKRLRELRHELSKILP